MKILIGLLSFSLLIGGIRTAQASDIFNIGRYYYCSLKDASKCLNEDERIFFMASTSIIFNQYNTGEEVNGKYVDIFVWKQERDKILLTYTEEGNWRMRKKGDKVVISVIGPEIISLESAYYIFLPTRACFVNVFEPKQVRNDANQSMEGVC